MLKPKVNTNIGVICGFSACWDESGVRVYGLADLEPAAGRVTYNKSFDGSFL